MRNIFPIIFLGLISLNLFPQGSILEFSFTAIDSSAWIQLDSIKVMNRTQGNEEMLHWPDTMLSLEVGPGDLLLFVGYATFSTVGIAEVNDDISSFTVYQNYPNPMADQSEISMYIPYTGKVHVMITDLQGKVVLRTDRQLDEGHHSFRFYPGGGNLNFFTAQWNGISRSIRMISTGQQDGKTCRLHYVGTQSGKPVLKTSVQVNDFIVRESGILDSPEENTTYTFQFATNIPCPGTPTVDYEGQIYNTIQVFSQCWLKENLNAGTMIDTLENMQDNGVIERYCYKNQPDSCAKYGGLYQWNEMMQYTTLEGAQGICPPGWHIPTDDEWKVLEGAVDSQFGIGDPEWDKYYGSRGYDVASNLKTTSGWTNNGNGTDLFGFSALPGAARNEDGMITYIGTIGYYWSSTDYLYPWSRRLQDIHSGTSRIKYNLDFGLSVRCLRD
jgi:uncharacterized protein (TIGR02145 family)